MQPSSPLLQAAGTCLATTGPSTTSACWHRWRARLQVRHTATLHTALLHFTSMFFNAHRNACAGCGVTLPDLLPPALYALQLHWTA